MIKIRQSVGVSHIISHFGVVLIRGLLVVKCPGGLAAVGCPAQFSLVGGDVVCFKIGGLEAIRCNFNCNIVDIGCIAVVTLAFKNNIDCPCHRDGGSLIVVPSGGRFGLRIGYVVISGIVAQCYSIGSDSVAIAGIHFEAFGIAATVISVNPERDDVAVSRGEIHCRKYQHGFRTTTLIGECQ